MISWNRKLPQFHTTGKICSTQILQLPLEHCAAFPTPALFGVERSAGLRFPWWKHFYKSEGGKLSHTISLQTCCIHDRAFSQPKAWKSHTLYNLLHWPSVESYRKSGQTQDVFLNSKQKSHKGWIWLLPAGIFFPSYLWLPGSTLKILFL